ncbi:hypothetical protein GW17_00038765 [Ensete ventricosum]|nr:hypothetical protein GW17_00038765 [Ensete ventricosum]
MAGGNVVVEATTSSSTESLLSSRVSYEHSLSHVDDKLRSLQSCLRWMCVDQSDTKHVMISWSLFLFLGIFVPTTSRFILSYAPTCRAYDVVVQLSLTSASGFSYLCLSAFIRCYDLCRFLFIDKMNFF